MSAQERKAAVASRLADLGMSKTVEGAYILAGVRKSTKQGARDVAVLAALLATLAYGNPKERKAAKAEVERITEKGICEYRRKDAPLMPPQLELDI